MRAFSESIERALASERTLAEANRELEARTARLQAQEAEQERLNTGGSRGSTGRRGTSL